MSNYLAIATVTATLNYILQEAVGADIPNAKVTTVRPDSLGNGTSDAGVNIYLYQITPNAAWRNVDLPTRTSAGELMHRPQVALNLHYMLTFHGDESLLEPQRLLGSVVRTLHTRPILTRQMITKVIESPPANLAFLQDSNLADEIELVRFSPLALDLEELSKLWSVFFHQMPYTLSVAYQGSVVLIDSEETPQTALPVRERNLYVVPFQQPVIEVIVSQDGQNAPIVEGGTAIIRGKRLSGDDTIVRIGEIEVTPQEVSDTQIRLQLPENALLAGIQGVQVVQPMLIGTPPVLHQGAESNVVAFVLRPTITAVSAPDSSTVTVTLTPKVGVGQRVVLLLNESATPDNRSARAYSFRSSNGQEETDSITFPISGVAAGEYFVRVHVDGAESPLILADNRHIVTIP